MYEFYCRVWLRTMKTYLGVKIDEIKLQDIFFGNHWDIETFVSYFSKLLMVIARKMLLLQISCTQKPQSILLYRRFLSALSIANMRYIGVQILCVKSILIIYSKFLIIKLIIIARYIAHIYCNPFDTEMHIKFFLHCWPLGSAWISISCYAQRYFIVVSNAHFIQL